MPPEPSLAAQSLNRVELGRLLCRPDTEEDADGGGDAEGDDDAAGADDRLPLQAEGDGEDQPHPEAKADQPAQQRDQGGLDEKLLEDRLLGGPERLADADLARALRH